MAAQFGGDDTTSSAAVLRRIGLLQLDALRRVDRAHNLTCLARMSANASVAMVDGQLWSPGPATVFETWVHAACLVPAEDWPLLRLARARAVNRAEQPSGAAYAEVLAIVGDSEHGVTIREIEGASGRTDGWDWSERKRAAEWLLWRGELICSERRANRRVYDLPERRLLATTIQTDLSREVILETLARRVLGSLGVATAHDIATYYNLTPEDTAEGLALCNAIPVTAESWSEQAWMLSATQLPRSASLREPRLIGPFDNLIWDRERTRRVHNFDYTFEAYKPAHKRTYGHYVMGVLNTTHQFLGRVDLQRKNGHLDVIRSFPEANVGKDDFHAALVTAVDVLANQLGATLSTP
ncbi:MAG: DNA glycosylase AlkZ-like family protein [Jatrophihabitans sp.]